MTKLTKKQIQVRQAILEYMAPGNRVYLSRRHVGASSQLRPALELASETTVRKVLDMLCDEGELDRTGNGRRAGWRRFTEAEKLNNTRIAALRAERHKLIKALRAHGVKADTGRHGRVSIRAADAERFLALLNSEEN